MYILESELFLNRRQVRTTYIRLETRCPGIILSFLKRIFVFFEKS